jgi:hypothetical protein
VNGPSDASSVDASLADATARDDVAKDVAESAKAKERSRCIVESRSSRRPLNVRAVYQERDALFNLFSRDATATIACFGPTIGDGEEARGISVGNLVE